MTRKNKEEKHLKKKLAHKLSNQEGSITIGLKHSRAMLAWIRAYRPRASAVRRFAPRGASTPCDPPAAICGTNKCILVFMIAIMALVAIVVTMIAWLSQLVQVFIS